MMRLPRPLSLTLALALLVATLLLCAHPSNAISTVTRKGKYLYQGNSRFYIKGVAYQEAAPAAAASQSNEDNGGFPEPDSFIDPLALPDACSRDVANLQDLGVNTIRVYSVNASLNHDSCMKTFSNAGIYVILDLALPMNGSINRAAPAWDVGLLDLYARNIQAFSGYDNLLAVNIANEVVTQVSNTVAAPFIKAAVRDVKAYLRSINLSNILISYSSTDGPAGATGWRDMLAYYLTCGSADTSIDLYGLNSYSWCGDSSYNASGYSRLTTELADLPVPAYLAEFGCVQGVGNGNRPWSEVSALFSSPMTNTFSGGVAFSYFPSSSGANYGLVSVNGNSVTKGNDFTTLRRQFSNVSAPTSAPSGSSSSPSYQTCKGGTTNFLASTNLPPTPNTQLCNCVRSSAYSCLATSAAQNSPNIIGDLTGQACSFLSDRGASCNAILADGAAGTYGNYSSCSASQRLEWAMSEYHELTMFNADSCDFAGNATAQATPSTGMAVDQAFSTCLGQFPIGVATPTPDVASSTRTSQSTASNTSKSTATSSAGASSGSTSLHAAATFSYAIAVSLLVSLGIAAGSLQII